MLSSAREIDFLRQTHTNLTNAEKCKRNQLSQTDTNLIMPRSIKNKTKQANKQNILDILIP